MKDGKSLRKRLTFGCDLKLCIALGLCCYLAVLSVIALTHEHDAHSHSEESCTACFYHSQHVGVELAPFAAIFLPLFDTTSPFYEAVFLSLDLPVNTRSRAPPAFSDKRSIAVC